MQKALHFTIPLSAGIGALLQFSFDFSIDWQIFLIADGMLKACPEVHMISFRELLINAKSGDEKALMEMFDIFRPTIEKASRNAGRKDEDLYDVIVMAFIQAISKFPIDKP